MTTDVPTRAPGRRLLPVVALALTATALAVFGRWHEADTSLGLLGRDYVEATRLKAQLTSVVLGMAGLQLALALWIYQRLPGAGSAPRWARLLHRANGYLTIAVSAPIAVHCLLAYGFQTSSSRLAVHSVAGCLFYGLFVAKVCVVRSSAQPPWALPALGTLVIVTIAVLWYSAALWVFNDYQVPLLR
jgi:hypothetical protein